MKKTTKKGKLASNLSFLIKELRKSKGFKSYESFALDNGMDRKQYWRIENGANFTINSFEKILEAHEISFEEFAELYKKFKSKFSK